MDITIKSTKLTGKGMFWDLCQKSNPVKVQTNEKRMKNFFFSFINKKLNKYLSNLIFCCFESLDSYYLWDCAQGMKLYFIYQWEQRQCVEYLRRTTSWYTVSHKKSGWNSTEETEFYKRNIRRNNYRWISQINKRNKLKVV